MAYQFLHHLTQASLPVVIYDSGLIQQIHGYETRRLLVTSAIQVPAKLPSSSGKGIQVIKITAAGRILARRHLRALDHERHT